MREFAARRDGVPRLSARHARSTGTQRDTDGFRSRVRNRFDGLLRHSRPSGDVGESSRPWFDVSGIHVQYGEVVAVRDVSLTMSQGEVLAIIGPNGAGKSSLLRAISGLVRPTRGEVWFDGRRIDRLPSEKIVRLGIAQVPEGRRLFSSMTTRENLELGGYTRGRSSVREELAVVIEHFPILGRRARQRAGSLSGGEQQMLALGRALMAKPRLLLFDEPTIGLAPLVVKEITEIIHDVSEHYGVGIILVEQNARLALSIAPRAYVIELGEVTAAGTSTDLAQDERVRSAYLAGSASTSGSNTEAGRA